MNIEDVEKMVDEAQAYAEEHPYTGETFSAELPSTIFTSGDGLDIGGITAEGSFTIGNSLTSMSPIWSTGVMIEPVSDEEAMGFFKQMKTSLRERLIDETEYAETINKMNNPTPTYISNYPYRQIPTRFSSEQLKRAHLDILMDEELRREG